ncbi:MAG: hypothetical protein U0517_00430 [Candidatus Andersenbacteria bacterium]
MQLTVPSFLRPGNRGTVNAMSGKKAHVPGPHAKRERLSLGKTPRATVVKTLLGGDEAAYQQFLEQDVAAAVEFARKELEYHDALDTLEANELDPVELVDEAVARLLEDKRGASLKPGRRLLGMVSEVVHEQVGSLEERERREISAEGNVKDPAEEAGFRTLGEHVLDFWQPDKDDSIYAFIPDPHVPDEAELLALRERQSELYQALDTLPAKQRQNFTLLAVAGWKLKELAEWRGVPVADLKKELAATQATLQKKLADLDLSGKHEVPPPHQHETSG